jgi:cytochrome P450
VRYHSVAEFRNRTLKYLPGELLLWRYHRGGPVTRAGRYVYLLGPAANRFVFANSELFCWREAFEALIPVDGETALIVSDGTAHRRRRRLVQPALHHRQVEHYLDIMAENADVAIDSWHAGQRIDIYQAFRSAIRRSTIQSLFGRRLAADAAFFGEHLQALLDLVDHLPQTVTWKRRLSTPQWRRAMAARGRVDERVYAEIERARRDSTDVDDHVLASLVHGTDEGGDALSDNEIRDQVVSLIAAGYETTSAAMAWAIYALLTVPGGWDRAAAEVRDVLGDRPPGSGDLEGLAYLGGVVRETLRLYPPAVVSARKVAQDFEFAGRRVKRGSMLLFSPYVTHRLPEPWPDPLSFRPQRWDSAEPGYRKPRTDEFLPFAAGPHRCIGAELATTEMTVMLARLLRGNSLFLPKQRIRPTSFAAMRPANGLLVDVGTGVRGGLAH